MVRETRPSPERILEAIQCAHAVNEERKFRREKFFADVAVLIGAGWREMYDSDSAPPMVEYTMPTLTLWVEPKEEQGFELCIYTGGYGSGSLRTTFRTPEDILKYVAEIERCLIAYPTS